MAVADLGAERTTLEPLELSVVCPAFNEARRLPSSLDACQAYLDASGLSYEFIVVDDGSTDETSELVAARAASWTHLRLLRLERNAGKGAAIRAGMLNARGRYRLFTDADMSAPIEQIHLLCAELRGDCAVAISSRRVAGAEIGVHQPGRRELMGRVYNHLVRLLALPGLRDTQCGFKLFTAEAAVACFEPLVTPGFGFDVEVLLRARQLGWRVAEVPVHWDHRDDSRVCALKDSLVVLADLVMLRPRMRSERRASLIRSVGLREQVWSAPLSEVAPDALSLQPGVGQGAATEPATGIGFSDVMPVAAAAGAPALG